MKTLFVGLSTLDIQYFVPRFPKSNVKVKTEAPTLLIGGPATNAAVAHSFLGGESILYSGVGQSAFTDQFHEDFKACHIHHIDFFEDKAQLPVLASVITSASNGDRNIFTCNPPLCDINVDFKRAFEEYSPDILMVDGFFPEVAVPMCKLAKKKAIPVVFDGGSGKHYLDDLLSFVDYAICSANFFPPACNTNEDVFKYLSQSGIKNIAITKGADQIHFNGQEGSGKIPVQTVRSVDTLGAGDFFHGAFCYFILQEKNFGPALRKSSILASRTCEYPGTREWMKKLKKEAFL